MKRVVVVSVLLLAACEVRHAYTGVPLHTHHAPTFVSAPVRVPQTGAILSSSGMSVRGEERHYDVTIENQSHKPRRFMYEQELFDYQGTLVHRYTLGPLEVGPAEKREFRGVLRLGPLERYVSTSTIRAVDLDREQH